MDESLNAGQLAAENPQGEAVRHSSLYGKRLPKFEGPRSFEASLHEDGLMAREASEPKPVPVSELQTNLAAQVDDLLMCVGSQKSLREILYKMLVFCQTPCTYAELEQFILASDEVVHSHVLQSPDALMTMLVKHAGLSKTPLDETGEIIGDERREELSEDEYDDLVATYRFETTEAGCCVVKMLDPQERFRALLGLSPSREQTFLAILAYCVEQPRKFPEIKAYYEAHDEFDKQTAVDSQQLAADYYVDKLEGAGMLIWRGRWEVSEAGKSALAAHGAEAGLDK